MRKLKIPNELRRFFNSMFLTIAISFIFFVILNLKGIDGQYDKLFSSIGSVGSIFIGYGAYRISQEQKRNIDLKISEEDKRLIREHYKKYEALFKDFRSEHSLNWLNEERHLISYESKILNLCREAQVELPLEIEIEMRKFYDFFEKWKNIKITEENKLTFLQNSRHLTRSVENQYSKYLKIPN